VLKKVAKTCQVYTTTCPRICGVKFEGRCGINHKYSLIINYLQFDAPLLKLLLINNLAVFMPQRQFEVILLRNFHPFLV